VDATAELIAIAELLGAPVTTTLQGLSAFPGNHRLHAGFALGQAAVPAVENAFSQLRRPARRSARASPEIPTGSYGWEPPANLVHIDINPRVFGANYEPVVALEGDARAVLGLLRDALGTSAEGERAATVAAAIGKDKRAYREEWLAHDSKGRVNPQRFFDALRARLPDDGIVVADDGNHTFLVAELMPIHAPRTYFSPSDFNSMGYCIPAAIGAKLARPERAVVGIVGDGAARMTGLEMSTAVRAGGRRRLVRVQRRRTRADRAGAGDALQPQDLHGAAGDRLRRPRAGEPRRVPLDAR
jgi:acetolactate synthase-1/2/3 large subunit